MRRFSPLRTPNRKLSEHKRTTNNVEEPDLHPRARWPSLMTTGRSVRDDPVRRTDLHPDLANIKIDKLIKQTPVAPGASHTCRRRPRGMTTAANQIARHRPGTKNTVKNETNDHKSPVAAVMATGQNAPDISVVGTPQCRDQRYLTDERGCWRRWRNASCNWASGCADRRC